MRRPLKRRQLAVALMLALAAVLSFDGGSARAAGVFNLTAESLSGPITSIAQSCNPSGVSSATITADGVATGPYPGTFSVTVTTTSGPFSISSGNVVSGGQILSWQETFTIESVFGEITGTKTLAGPGTPTISFCGLGQMNQFQADADALAYNANFAGQTDQGTAGAGFAFVGLNTGISNFGESFTSIPTTTPGKATGGGQIADPTSTTNKDTTFAFTAYSSDQTGIHARCNVNNDTVHILCSDATAYRQLANAAVFSGPAVVNDTQTTYQISVQDNANPGAGKDVFSISTGVGYSTGGVLTQGNIQVHQ
jgi:hypothetical protein